MIYSQPYNDASLEQGDLIDGCPMLRVQSFDPANGQPQVLDFEIRRIIVLTQTCDLANEKAL